MSRSNLLGTLAATLAAVLWSSAARADEVRVHVDSPRPVTLETRAGGDVAWSVACESPCDVSVQTDGDFRIAGPNVTTSEPFVLRPRGELVALRVRPASRTVRALSVTGIILGGAVSLGALLVGQALVTSSALSGAAGGMCGLTSSNIYDSAADRPSCSGQSGSHSDFTPYAVTSIAGAALAVAGIVGIVAEGGTNVSSPDALPLAPREPTKERMPQSGVPEGTARSPMPPTHSEARGAPGAFLVPLVSLSF
jgi:hypothetical protein